METLKTRCSGKTQQWVEVSGQAGYSQLSRPLPSTLFNIKFKKHFYLLSKPNPISKLFMSYLWSVPCRPSCEVGARRPILQMGKLRLRGLGVSGAWRRQRPAAMSSCAQHRGEGRALALHEMDGRRVGLPRPPEQWPVFLCW